MKIPEKKEKGTNEREKGAALFSFSFLYYLFIRSPSRQNPKSEQEKIEGKIKIKERRPRAHVAFCNNCGDFLVIFLLHFFIYFLFVF
jgi:hypothetical protein